jgi:maltose alpha-D-glucosyltransferase/alpha-amylase
VLVLIDGWASFWPDRVAPWRTGAATKLRAQLEGSVLPKFLASQRWFAGKGAPIDGVRLSEYGPWESSNGRWLMSLMDVESRGETTRYFLPLSIVFEDAEETRWSKLQPAAFARVRQQATVGVLADAVADDVFCRSLVEAIGAGVMHRTEHGTIAFTPTKAFSELRGDPAAALTAGQQFGQSSNSTLRIGDRFFLKVYRKLQPGLNPELEIGRFLTDVAHFPSCVPVAGAVEYRGGDGTIHTLALLQAFVQNQGDGWDYTLNYLMRFLEDRRGGSDPPQDAHGVYFELMRMLAQRTAELHVALASNDDDPAFAPEPITADDLRLWQSSIQADARATLELLSATEPLAEGVRADATTLLESRGALERRIDSLVAAVKSAGEPYGLRIRHHGDYHLGQVLVKRNDFIIVDFEGEPSRPLAERRIKHSPLRDVAGMFRSFTYARQAALQRCSITSSENCAKWDPLLGEWEQETRAIFLRIYNEIANAAALYPNLARARPLLELFEIEKALYELRYELRNRPDWVAIPLRSLVAFAS